MPLGEGGPHELREKEGHPTLKRRYFTVIGSSNVKLVEDRHKNAAYHNKHWNVNINDLD